MSSFSLSPSITHTTLSLNGTWVKGAVNSLAVQSSRLVPTFPDTCQCVPLRGRAVPTRARALTQVGSISLRTTAGCMFDSQEEIVAADNLQISCKSIIYCTSNWKPLLWIISMQVNNNFPEACNVLKAVVFVSFYTKECDPTKEMGPETVWGVCVWPSHVCGPLTVETISSLHRHKTPFDVERLLYKESGFMNFWRPPFQGYKVPNMHQLFIHSRFSPTPRFTHRGLISSCVFLSSFHLASALSLTLLKVLYIKSSA